MKYDPEKHHRRSIRLKDYDYALAGAYFVTICVDERRCLLGHIDNDEMHLNQCGVIVLETWLWLEKQYSYVELDAWVVMPNHIHGIVVIDDSVVKQRKPLGQLIGAFKTVSTKQINRLSGVGGAIFWQRDFHDHIIRDEAGLNFIREYVYNNPAMWLKDSQYSDV